MRLARLRLNRRPYCSSSGSSSTDRAKLIEYQTEGLIRLRVQFIYKQDSATTTSPCSRVGKNTNTTSHRMCMSKYSISQRKSKSLSHRTSQDVNQRTTTRNSPKLISQSHVIASTHMTRRHMVQYKSQYRNITPFSGGMPTFLNSKVNKGPTAHDPDRQCL